MKAATHTEIYRRFEGRLRRHPLRFVTITTSGIRLAFKRKLPLLLLYAPIGIAAIVCSFLVHLKFAAESGNVPGIGGEQAAALAAVTGRLLEVSQLIVDFVTHAMVRVMALLAIAWYGAGLIAEDRRLGAHLLYFSRPITRLDYLLGKFFAAAFFGACGVLVPGMAICGVAAFSSPHWSFLTRQTDVILATLGFGTLWIVVVTAIVLCISSLVERKTLALAGVIGLVFLVEAVSNLLAVLTDDPRFRLLSLFRNFERIADWMFHRPEHLAWDVSSSFAVVGAVTAVALAVLARRLRRMEVVA